MDLKGMAAGVGEMFFGGKSGGLTVTGFNALRIETQEKYKLPTVESDGSDGKDPYYVRRRYGVAASMVPAVNCAVHVLSSVMAGLPKTVARLLDPLTDEWEPLPDHPVSWLMRYPSKIFDPYEYWEWVFRCLFSRGNGYSEIIRYGGFPVELIPVEVWVTPLFGKVRRSVRPIFGNQRYRDLEPWKLLAIHGPGFDGFSSPSPVMRDAASVMAMTEAAQTYNLRSLKEGLSTRTAVEIDPAVGIRTTAQLDDLWKKLKQEFHGAEKAGGTPVLPPGAKLKSTQGMLSNVDIQLIEILKWTIEDVARVFSVAPRILQHYHEGFRASKDVEAQFEDFERISIRPHVQRAQHQLGAKFLTSRERLDNLCIRMPTDMLKLGSWTERVGAVDKAVARAGVLTINEGRQLLGRKPRPDGDRLVEPKGAPAQNGDDKGGKSDD